MRCTQYHPAYPVHPAENQGCEFIVADPERVCPVQPLRPKCLHGDPGDREFAP
jgi:hypothetical protein